MAGISPIPEYQMPGPENLPRNVARWQLDPHRVILLVHDMQNYFVRPFGKSPGEDLVGNVVALRERFTKRGAQVAYTAQPGGMTREQRGLLRDFWGSGMRTEPADRGIVEPLRPVPADWVLTKWRYSAFHGSDLLGRMRECGRDQLVLCGVYAHVGVLLTAVEAFTHDIETFLVADAVADLSEEFHELAVSYAAQRCAVVMTTGMVLDQLDQRDQLDALSAPVGLRTDR